MEPVNLNPGEFVHFSWKDSSYEPGWKYGQERSGGIVHVQSVGVVVETTDEHLTITHAVDRENGGAMCPLSVPWGVITELDRITL
jgi:hypothetical protein